MYWIAGFEFEPFGANGNSNFDGKIALKKLTDLTVIILGTNGNPEFESGDVDGFYEPSSGTDEANGNVYPSVEPSSGTGLVNGNGNGNGDPAFETASGFDGNTQLESIDGPFGATGDIFQDSTQGKTHRTVLSIAKYIWTLNLYIWFLENTFDAAASLDYIDQTDFTDSSIVGERTNPSTRAFDKVKALYINCIA